MSDWIRPKIAGAMLGCTPVTAARYGKTGLIESCLTPSGQILLSREAVESWVNRRTKVSTTVTVVEAP